MPVARPGGRCLVLLLLATSASFGSSAAALQGSATSDAAAAQPPSPRRLNAVVMGAPRAFSSVVERVVGSPGTPGLTELEDLANAGLTAPDGAGVLRPVLADAVPTLENGLWRIFPDGRMETTWRIRPNARWHDGAPFTVDDLLFTMTVAQDQQLSWWGDPLVRLVESARADGGLTPASGPAVTVLWRAPAIDADMFFSRVAAQPLPRHLLGDAYATENSQFLRHAYWSSQFIGTGPFRVKEYIPSLVASLEANSQYVLGRPRLDEVVVRFIPDINTLVAQILALVVDLSLGPTVGASDATAVRARWRGGRVESGPFTRWVAIYPQFIDPEPPIIASLPFRRALYHAIDRQELAAMLTGGLAPEADAIIPPNDSAFADIEGQIAHYDYDPGYAFMLIEGLGYEGGADDFFLDAAGERLSVEIRTSGAATHSRSSVAVADYWARVGVEATVTVYPGAQPLAPEARSTFPGFDLRTEPAGAGALLRYHSSRTPLPENRFTGSNVSRYASPELNALIDRYYVTIPSAERIPVLGQIVGHMSDRLPVMGLFFDTDPVLIRDTLVNVVPPTAATASVAWNSHEWDIRR